MGDNSRSERGSNKGRSSVGCLLLRRSRRRANSEPPKGKRHDRQTSCSSRTLKPSKIPREERYRVAKNSESDSGFLSFESGGIKRDEHIESVSINHQLHNPQDGEMSSQNFTTKSGKRSTCTRKESNVPSFSEADMSDVTENLKDFYDDDRLYDSDSLSIDSDDICLRCGCMPRIFKSHNSHRSSKRTRSIGSQTVNSDDIFDLRTKTLRKLSQLQNVVAESEIMGKSKCFINLVLSEHRCVDTAYCNKVKFAALNAHLRTLIDCMPKTHCDCESKIKFTNCILNRVGYISQRRNAICETNELSGETVCRAFCNFMTLKALLRYDLL